MSAEKAPPPLFKKGNPGGPGRPTDLKRLEKVIPGFRHLHNLTRKELVDIGNVMIKGDMGSLRRIHADPASPVILANLAAVALKIYERGDMQALDMLLTRLIGRPPTEIQHGGAIGGTHGSTVIVTLPSNGREVRVIDVETKPAAALPVMPVEEFDFG